MEEIEFAKKEEDNKINEMLDETLKKWFFSKFEKYSETQKYSIPEIKAKNNILIAAPTGGTKTLSSFLAIFDRLIRLIKTNSLEEKIYAVYCSPLKALSNDVYFNIITPIEEINNLLKNDGFEKTIRVGLRTGDSSQKEREKHKKEIPHILITTPESLAILLNTSLKESLKFIEYVIIDEVHSLAENKRGVHLSLTLERLEEISQKSFVRIGLSATVAPLEEIAKYLVGKGRSCKIADVYIPKKFSIEIINSLKDIDTNNKLLEKINEIVEKQRTTLIFTNTRAATERIIKNLKEKFPTKYLDNIGAHHSSLSKEERKIVEEKLRNGKLKVVVSSTSLELGIDIGFIDLVILLGSPKSVSRALQRIGRAGHKLHETAKGVFVISDYDDLVECSVIKKNSLEKKIDKVHIPKNCLDVLSQHIVGMVLNKDYNLNDLFEIIKKSYCYKELTREEFLSVISYLAGEYSLKIKNFYPKLYYDKEKNIVKKRGKLLKVIYLTNIGTIPDESYLNVLTKEKKEIGKIDEIFFDSLRKGDVFSLGGKPYTFLYEKGMNVYVAPSERSPNIPHWYSEMLPLSFTTAESIQNFRKLLKEKIEKELPKKEIIDFIKSYLYSNEENAEEIYNYFIKQKKVSHIPNEKEILIENYTGEKNFFLFHCVFGRRINDAFSRLLSYLLAMERKKDVEIGVNDNGFYLAGEDLNFQLIDRTVNKIRKDNIRELLEKSLEKTEILKRRFRHCATRGLMILRNYKGKRKSVGKQKMSSKIMLGVISKLTKNFPLLKEAKREILEDVMDIKNLERIIEKIERKEIVFIKKKTIIPSPFAINLVFQSHQDYLRIEDKIKFLKRMHEIYEKL
ncbi:MAG: ATP-dependent helicase [Candidatus Pacearchaeota archaeon]